MFQIKMLKLRICDQPVRMLLAMINATYLGNNSRGVFVATIFQLCRIKEVCVIS